MTTTTPAWSVGPLDFRPGGVFTLNGILTMERETEERARMSNRIQRVSLGALLKRYSEHATPNCGPPDDDSDSYWFYVIHKDDGLYLPTESDGNAERFATIFRDVWQAIPEADCAKMVQHWRTHPERQACGFVISPAIFLENGWWSRGERVDGSCSPTGHVFRFYAPTIDWMPAEAVAWVIAHELGHMMYRVQNPELLKTATPQPTITRQEALEHLAFLAGTTPEAVDRDYTQRGRNPILQVHALLDTEENAADEQAGNWLGFDESAYCQWNKTHLHESDRLHKQYG